MFTKKKRKRLKKTKNKYSGGNKCKKNIYKIENFEYLPIDEAIITSGRNCKIKNSYGIRPKMLINFSMPYDIYENKKNILMKTIAVSLDGKENEFSTIKYNMENVLENYDSHPGGRIKFERESKSWLNLTTEMSLNATTYHYLYPDIKIRENAIFQIEFYPCRFLLKSGLTHQNLFVEIMPDSEDILPGDNTEDIIIGSEWNTFDIYHKNKLELCEKLNNIPVIVNQITDIPIGDIYLDPSAESTKKECNRSKKSKK